MEILLFIIVWYAAGLLLVRLAFNISSINKMSISAVLVFSLFGPFAVGFVMIELISSDKTPYQEFFKKETK